MELLRIWETKEVDKVWTYASGVVTFKIAPFNTAQVAVGYIDKQYKNNSSDFYHQFRNEAENIAKTEPNKNVLDTSMK